jgi:predicted naringenin-chalcone synthase
VASCVVAKEGNGLSVDRVIDVTNLRAKDYMIGYARIAALSEPFKLGIYSHLDRKLPKLGVEYTTIAVKRLLGRSAETALKTVKKWAIHTGSRKILNLIADHYQIQPEKLKESREVLRECGNLSGASLPFILEKAVSESKLSRGDIILMLGYGWGFSASACLLKLERSMRASAHAQH